MRNFITDLLWYGVSDKVMIPQEEYPDINFVGLLIGPRGNTLKTLEKEVTRRKNKLRVDTKGSNIFFKNVYALKK